MATTIPNEYTAVGSMAVPDGGFNFTPTDTGGGRLLDPHSAVDSPIYRISRNVISTVAGVINVVYKNGYHALVPVGVGSNPMQVTHIYVTGPPDTTAGIVSAGVHIQF